MKKAPEAFRTISEVSDILDTPAHVLRFWESKFYQIRPVKRAGGRRYYRPDDLALLAGIRLLLQDQGMTIRGVQKVLQEQGVRHVASLAPDASTEESFEAGTYSDTDEAETAQDPVGARVHRPQDIATPTTAPPPRAASVRPAAPLPLLPEAPEAVPENAPAALRAASPPKPEYDADAPSEGDGVAATPAHEDAPEPAFEAPFPTPPLSGPPDSAQPEPEQSDAELSSSDGPPSDLPLPELPAPEPIATTRPQVAPAPDLSDRALNLGASTERPARILRGLPRHALAADHDKAAMLARRIDALLERMSDASGAGRW